MVDRSAHGIRVTSRWKDPLRPDGRHRIEHWRRDNQVYFITATVHQHLPAFACEEAKTAFWQRFEHHAAAHGFTPWVTALMDNHYHTLGYLRDGDRLPRLMQRLHGSVAKLVNDLLPERIRPFWRNIKGAEYFDGCIRDETQARRAFHYTCLQPVRAKLCDDWHEYPHVRVTVDIDHAVRRAHQLDAFLGGVPYKRYDDRSAR